MAQGLLTLLPYSPILSPVVSCPHDLSGSSRNSYHQKHDHEEASQHIALIFINTVAPGFVSTEKVWICEACRVRATCLAATFKYVAEVNKALEQMERLKVLTNCVLTNDLL
jgi:hypothetical protein